jgi:hypothetical protein
MIEIFRREENSVAEQLVLASLNELKQGNLPNAKWQSVMEGAKK